MLDKSAFSEAIETVLQDEGRLTVALVPGVFLPVGSDQPIDARFRTRHRIETVRRIWASADIHAAALVAMLREDYDAARLWSEYLANEINYDKLNLKDADDLGIDQARVLATPPLRSTVGLIDALMKDIYSAGSLPAVTYAVIAEWHWARSTVLNQERAKEQIGSEFMKAVASHPEVGSPKDHSSVVVEVAHRLIMRRQDGLAQFVTSLRHISAFFRSYFAELYMMAGMEAGPRQPDEPKV